VSNLCPIHRQSTDCRQVHFATTPTLGLVTLFDYKIIDKTRNGLNNYLTTHGVKLMIRHETLVLGQLGYGEGKTESLPTARELVGGILSLPMYNQIVKNDAHYVKNCVSKPHES